MPKEKIMYAEMGGYISSLLRTHFGKGPTSVFVTIKQPYIVIHFRGFLAPMEAVLLKKGEWKRVLETRRLLINELRNDIIKNIWRIANLDVQEFYADWNLDQESGLLIGVTSEEAPETEFVWPDQIDKSAFEQAVAAASEKAEKKPGAIESYWLNDRTILVKRVEILVGIEKVLIAEGYTEILKLAKRPLERHLLLEAQLEKVLGRSINEVYLDWNFDRDVGYIVFVIDSVKENNN